MSFSLDVHKSRLRCSSKVTEQEGARRQTSLTLWLLILVENHAINHDVVARSDVMDADWDTHLNSRSYGIFIEDLAAPRHISNCLSEVVTPRPATFPEYNRTSRSVLSDRAVAFSRGGRCRSLRDLRPCERGHNCQNYAD